MATMQNQQYTPLAAAAGPAAQRAEAMDWSQEITPPRGPAMGMTPAAVQRPTAAAAPTVNQRPAAGMVPAASQRPATGTPPAESWRPSESNLGVAPGTELDMKNGLPTEVIDAPTTAAEAESGSWRAMLSRNLGNYVVATFLIGTQGTVSWEGILYDVGNNYLTIYQAGRDRYIVCDIYSLKYIEFYDTTRRQLCNEILRQQNR